MQEIFQQLVNLSQAGLAMNKSVMEIAAKANDLGVWGDMEPEFNAALEKTEVFVAVLQEFERTMTDIASGQKPAETKGTPVW